MKTLMNIGMAPTSNWTAGALAPNRLVPHARWSQYLLAGGPSFESIQLTPKSKTIYLYILRRG